MKMKGLNKKIIFIMMGTIALMALILVIWRYEAWEIISIEYLRKYTNGIRDLGPLGLMLYIVAFALATIICLPSLPFTLLGGITYGTFLGIIYASIGDLIGSTLAFLMGRYIIRERIEKRLSGNKTFHEINQGVKEDGWRIVILTRMVPLIPHWLQNYAYGLTSISLGKYALLTLISIIPGTAVWIIAINTVGSGGADARKTMLYLSIATVFIIAISYIPKYIYKRKEAKK